MTVKVIKDNFTPSKPWAIDITFANGSKGKDGPFKTKGAAEEAATVHRLFVKTVDGIV
tara:strand:+ start:855 stop:1028 length:174 start_codon:yes stop_codon:yes gene_type:complete